MLQEDCINADDSEVQEGSSAMAEGKGGEGRGCEPRYLVDEVCVRTPFYEELHDISVVKSCGHHQRSRCG